MTTTPQYHARLISAGPVRTRLNRAGEVVVSPTAVSAAVAAGLFENLACFIDHSNGNPSVRDLLGVWHDVTWDAAAGAAHGVLTAYENSETEPVLARLEQLLAAQGERPCARHRHFAGFPPALGGGRARAGWFPAY